MKRTIWPASAILVALTASAVALATPNVAFAGSHVYCGAPNYVYPGYPCYSGEAHTYDYNSSNYAGSGSFQFCEELSYSSVFYSYRCRGTPGTVEGWSDDNLNAPYPNGNTFMHDIEVNNDNNRHTLSGFSIW